MPPAKKPRTDHDEVLGCVQNHGSLIEDDSSEDSITVTIHCCNNYGLQLAVLQKLEENGYDYACNFITLNNLTEMGFKLGEKAALQDAVERWAIHCVF